MLLTLSSKTTDSPPDELLLSTCNNDTVHCVFIVCDIQPAHPYFSAQVHSASYPCWAANSISFLTE